MIYDFLQLVLLQSVLQNMSRQLEKLKRDSQKREEEYTKKMQQYEQIVADLQAENQKLRKFIDDQPLSSNLYLSNSPIYELQEGVTTPQKQKEITESQNRQGELNMGDLISENEELRKQLCELTRTYQQQIDQMTFCFLEIKNAYLQKFGQIQSSNHSSLVQSRTPHFHFSKIYDKMIKQFQQQRKKYIEKIEELLIYITSLQKKEEEYQQTIRKVKFEQDIVKEELKIYKRIR